jgi:hypothetical protein
MSKFTPGPWEAFVSADVASVVKNKQGLGIARVVDDYDAYLIAAAPAMYESLQMIISEIEASDEMLKNGHVCGLTRKQMDGVLLARAALRTADGDE